MGMLKEPKYLFASRFDVPGVSDPKSFAVDDTRGIPVFVTASIVMRGLSGTRMGTRRVECETKNKRVITNRVFHARSCTANNGTPCLNGATERRRIGKITDRIKKKKKTNRVHGL